MPGGSRASNHRQSRPAALPRPLKSSRWRARCPLRVPEPFAAHPARVLLRFVSATQRCDVSALRAERYEPRSCLVRDACCRAAPGLLVVFAVCSRAACWRRLRRHHPSLRSSPFALAPFGTHIPRKLHLRS